MKHEWLLTALGVLVVVLLANTHEQRVPGALIADGTFPPGHALSVPAPSMLGLQGSGTAR